MNNKLTQKKSFRVGLWFCFPPQHQKFLGSLHTAFQRNLVCFHSNTSSSHYLKVELPDKTWHRSHFLCRICMIYFSFESLDPVHCWGLHRSYSPHWSHWGDFPITLSTHVSWCFPHHHLTCLRKIAQVKNSTKMLFWYAVQRKLRASRPLRHESHHLCHFYNIKFFPHVHSSGFWLQRISGSVSESVKWVHTISIWVF